MSDTIDSRQNYIAMDTLCDTVEAIKDIVDSTILNAKLTISNLCTQSIVDDDTIKTVKPYNKIEKPYENSQTILRKEFETFNPNDEKILKFTIGEPIVDQKNPFKNIHVTGKDKKTAPPVPVRRSTLSVRKTDTQQLRERETERKIDKKDQGDKQCEQQKNQTNIQQNNVIIGKQSAVEFITTEEVLKQSKYVKTYIKNPDPFFVYDPTVLARLKSEELSDIAGKKPKRKQPLTEQSFDRLKETRTLTKNHLEATNNKKEPELTTFKKCSKPNYPELANLKIRTGSNSNGAYFSPAEVTKNAKKFDERVKKLQINSDDDLDDIDVPLTKSDSCDELDLHTPDEHEANESKSMTNNSPKIPSFTNTISSEEFQAYLKWKGLTLMPKRDVNSPAPTATPSSTPTYSRKISVLQRFSNSFFATRKKTTPKENKTLPRTVYSNSDKYSKYKTNELSQNGQLKNAAQPCQTANPSEFAANPSKINVRSKWKLHMSNSKRDNLPLQCHKEQQSVIPIHVAPKNNLGPFTNAISMDRIQIKEGQEGQNLTRLGSVSLYPSEAISMTSDQYPKATSTPIRKAMEQQRQQQVDAASNDHKEWKQLSAIKEVIDKKLYYKVLKQQQDQQHQQQSQSEENIYEHLHSQQQLQQYFVRGQHQRSTFSGITDRNQQLILDGSGTRVLPIHQPSPRYQCVMEELKVPNSQRMRRGYESESETPEILRRKNSTAARRIGGLFTREEILDRVKEFCRKSFNRSPLPSAAKMQQICERRNNNKNNSNSCADISPYAPLKANMRHLIARPEVPQRVQSLPRVGLAPGGASFSSPIYAHVNKRSSLLSNDSTEKYLSSEQYSKRSLLALAPSEYVLIRTENGLQAAKLLHRHNNSNLYMQSKYGNASQLGYVRNEELQNGRATPLILDCCRQQTSQVYWTPDQMLLQKSPRRVIEHMYPLPELKLQMPQSYYQANTNTRQYATNTVSRGNRLQLGAQNISDCDFSSEAGELRRPLKKST